MILIPITRDNSTNQMKYFYQLDNIFYTFILSKFIAASRMSLYYMYPKIKMTIHICFKSKPASSNILVFENVL